VQIAAAGVVPAIFGAIAGVVLGESAAGYWALQAVAALGGMVAGFEHRDGWGGADRGLVGGFIFGSALLITHELVGTHEQVSLGSFPPLLPVITAIVGMLLGALGGRIARVGRERAGARPSESATP